jgi:hypothetical protein
MSIKKENNSMVTTKKAGAKRTAKASGKREAATTGRTLKVTTSPRVKFLILTVHLQKAFKQAGCPGCRSGIDRIVFTDIDQVLTNLR